MLFLPASTESLMCLHPTFTGTKCAAALISSTAWNIHISACALGMEQLHQGTKQVISKG